MQGRVKRTLLDLEDVARNLLQTLSDAVAVNRAEGGNFEDQEIERSLREVGFWRIHFCMPRAPTYTTTTCRRSRRDSGGGGGGMARRGVPDGDGDGGRLKRR